MHLLLFVAEIKSTEFAWLSLHSLVRDNELYSAFEVIMAFYDSHN
jgi:hypothetical protein